MKTTEFIPTGTVILHIEKGDAVVRGQAGRTAAQINLPPDAVAEPVIEALETETHVRVAQIVSLNLPAGADFVLRGAPSDVVLRNLGEVWLDGCRGDLVASDLAALQVEGEIRGDVALRKIKGAARLLVAKGDLAAAHLGELNVDEVKGNASVTGVDFVQFSAVSGDLAVTTAQSVQIREVHGDAAFSSVSNATDVKLVDGDLSVTSPGQTLAAAEVHGDVHLKGPLQAQGKYWINAFGSVVVRASGDMRIDVRAGGEVLAGPDILLEVQEDGRKRALAGDREMAADLNIEAKGDVVLNSAQPWYGHHSASVEREVKQAMSEVQKELKRAAVTMRGEMRGAKDDIVRELGREDIAGTVGGSVRDIVRDLLDSLDPNAAAQPSTPAPPASDNEEVKMILEMLANGTISVEEAERLIEALKA